MSKNYRIKDACFACTTPYQLVGALNIVRHLNITSDIYIFGMFQGYDDVARRIEELGVFDEVFAVNCEKFSFLGKVDTTFEAQRKAMKQMIFASRYVSMFLPDDVSYNTFYSSSRAHVKNLLLSVLQKRNPNIHVSIYDDGLGSYLKNSHVLKTSKMRNSFEQLLGWNLYNPSNIDIQLYLPEIAILPEELNSCPLRKMPIMDLKSNSDKEVLKTIFGVKEQVNISERVILFDNVRGSMQKKKLFMGVDKCYREILNIAGKENVILKPHPRSIEKSKVIVETIKDAGVPMEVFYADFKDLEDRILITYNSTAIYTPKMLFGEEPWVISLHRLVESSIQGDAESLYSTFLKTYKNKDKMFAPISMKELKEYLRSVLRGE